MSVQSGTWCGTIDGTNTGATLAELRSSGPSIYGTIYIVDPVYGVAKYDAAGAARSARDVRLVLSPDQEAAADGHGVVTVLAQIQEGRLLVGEWRSSIGTSGSLQVQFLGQVQQAERKFLVNIKNLLARSRMSGFRLILRLL